MATGDETIVETSNTIASIRRKKDDNVWEITATATHDADDTGDVTLSVPINGILQKVILVVPNFTNAITGQVQINDNADVTIFDSGEQAKNATYTFNVSEPLSGTIDIVVGVSGAAGGTGGSIVVYLRGV